MLKPEQVLAEIRRSRERADDPISFHWVEIGTQDSGGDRDGFRRALHDLASADPVLTVVLRTSGFMDPNSVMNDLAEVLEGAKRHLVRGALRERIGRTRRLDVVLIARRELALAITSSPLVLPGWFPIRPGKEVTARIEDLTWTASVPLSAPEARVGDLRRLLCDLDRAMLKRLKVVGLRDHRVTRSLLDRLNMDLDKARAELDGVRNPRDYRPRSIGPTLISCLWKEAVSTHTNALPRLAKALVTALGVADGDIGSHKESIAAVLGRPTNPLRDTVRWGFDLIVTVGAACQLATAAAHADAYSRYPVRLVGSLSRDLQRSLDGFVSLLEVLD